MRAALDTNILAYAEGVNGMEAKRAALSLLRPLPRKAVMVPVQALGELFNVLVRKAKRPRPDARTAVLRWRNTYTPIDTSTQVFVAAVDLAASHQLRVWDSVMLSAAAEGACRLLLSEDLQDGFTWRGVTVVNPFAADPNPLLCDLFASNPRGA